MGVSMTGPAAGAIVMLLGLVLLFAPANLLYRGNRPVVRRRGPDPPVPGWAKAFFRVLGLLLLALGAALIWPALQ